MVEIRNGFQKCPRRLPYYGVSAGSIATGLERPGPGGQELELGKQTPLVASLHQWHPDIF